MGAPHAANLVSPPPTGAAMAARGPWGRGRQTARPWGRRRQTATCTPTLKQYPCRCGRNAHQARVLMFCEVFFKCTRVASDVTKLLDHPAVPTLEPCGRVRLTTFRVHFKTVLACTRTRRRMPCRASHAPISVTYLCNDRSWIGTGELHHAAPQLRQQWRWRWRRRAQGSGVPAAALVGD